MTPPKSPAKAAKAPARPRKSARAAAPAPDEAALRDAVVAAARRLAETGLNTGSSGNVSARCGEAMLITPSGVAPAAITAESLALMPLSGDPADWTGPKRPSSEWRFHRDILNARPDLSAVVHAHAAHCTALAMTRRGIPASHYMVALFGGDDVRCAPYARFGSQALSDAALAALEGRFACLLANHGMIAAGPTLARAMFLAEELETLAQQHVLALSLGGPHILTPREIEETAEAMADRGYGQAD